MYRVPYNMNSSTLRPCSKFMDELNCCALRYSFINRSMPKKKEGDEYPIELSCVLVQGEVLRRATLAFR